METFDGGPSIPFLGSDDVGFDDGAIELDGNFDAGVQDAARPDANVSRPSRFPYAPRNFNPSTLQPQGNVVINCAAEIRVRGATAQLTWCRGSDEPTVYSANNETAILAMYSFTITSSGSLTILGPTPVIFAVFGSVELYGPIRSNHNAQKPSAPLGCMGGAGENGSNDGNGGGGGGSFGASGGPGGTTLGTGGAGGQDIRDALVPILAGCPGGNGGFVGDQAGGLGGAGGGALQISAAQRFFISSIISANGQGGQGGPGDSGGGGGGSGGGILIEADEVSLVEGTFLTANGGAGGGGSAHDATGIDGQDGQENSGVPAEGGLGGSQEVYGGPGGAWTSWEGQAGGGSTQGIGGGGGGGSVGLILIYASTNCVIDGAPRFSPWPPTECPGPYPYR